jgi:hypothetical protein
MKYDGCFFYHSSNDLKFIIIDAFVLFDSSNDLKFIIIDAFVLFDGVDYFMLFDAVRIRAESEKINRGCLVQINRIFG